MSKKIFLLCSYCLMFCALLAQTRSPELKLEPKYKVEADTSAYEEKPYFLLIDQSEKALKEGDYQSAALRLVEAMGMEPENELNVALLSNLGMIYFYDDQDSMALVVLDEAIKRSPKLIAARENRARVLTGMGQDTKAMKEFERILDLDSLNLNARFMHGMISLYNGDLMSAERDFDILQNVVPAGKSTWLALATLYSMTSREQEAVSYLKKLLEIEPAMEYYERLIACYLTLDDLDNASKFLGEAISKYPSDSELYFYKAILNKRRYLPEDAKRDAQRAIELGADPERVKMLLAK